MKKNKMINKLEVYELDSNITDKLKKRAGGWSITSLVLGIISIPIGSILFGILAIIFGAIGLKKQQRFSLAGIILGVVGVIVWAVAILIIAIKYPTFLRTFLGW
jgi:spore maturation protein SpmB